MNPQAKCLQGKRALITGASRGLGRALCEAFASEGASIAFTYTRDEEGASQTIAAVSSVAGNIPDSTRAFKVSVLDTAATEAMVAELERTWGGIDILVNNTGITQILPFALIDEEDWDRVMDVNVKGTFLTSKIVLPGMVRRKAGVILNIGSLAGSRMI